MLSRRKTLGRIETMERRIRRPGRSRSTASEWQRKNVVGWILGQRKGTSYENAEKEESESPASEA